MKSVKVLIFILAISAVTFCGCNSNGSKYTVNDKHSIYYKGDGVSEDDAKKVGTYLTEIGLFGDHEMDAQISADKNSTDMKVKFIVDKSKVTPEVETAMMNIGNDMAGKLYPAKTLHIILADEHFEDIKDLGIAKAQQQQPQQNNTETNQTDDSK